MSDVNHDGATHRTVHPDGPPVTFLINRRLFWIVVPSLITLLSSVTVGAASWLTTVHAKINAVEAEQRLDKAVINTELEEIKRRLDRIEKKLDRALEKP